MTEHDDQRAASRHRPWPAWPRSIDDLASLARYVSPEAVRGRRLTPSRDPGDSDQALVRRAYERLRERRLGYGLEPWAERDVQQVRDPDLILRDGWGTCLDLAAMYAAACLELKVAPLLAVVPAHAPMHVLVIVAPGRLRTEPERIPVLLDGAERTSEDGVTLFSDPAGMLGAIAAGDVVAIDLQTAATDGRGGLGGDFEAAEAAAREYLRGGVRLVDVAYLHRREDGVAPLPSAGPPPIGTYVSGSYAAFERYAVHEPLMRELADASGTIALLGPPGQGKSAIARQIALEEESGAAWFLTASDPQALDRDLAEALLRERGMAAADTSGPSRSEFARLAPLRLHDAVGRWIVVLDNADDDPGRILPRLPRPGPDQLVLITTTNREWEQVPGVEVRRLPPVDAERIERDLGGDELRRLVAGRQLMLQAFRRFMQRTGWSAAEIAEAAPPEGIAEDLRGPAALWSAIRQAPGFDEEKLRMAARSGLLPPDHQPVEALRALDPDADRHVGWLADHGLVTFEEELGVVRMHRLFGAAVRADLDRAAADVRDQVVDELVVSEPTRRALDARGDFETIDRLAARLADVDGDPGSPDRALGTRLHRVASLLELHGHTPRSAAIYALSERHVRDDPELLAEALHGQARAVNQHPGRDPDRVRRALAMAREAHELMVGIGKADDAGRYLAMRGLLTKVLATRMTPSGAERHALLTEALGILEEAHRMRSARLADDDQELARSLFNLAGPHVDLAQAERARAAAHLDEAEAIYREVRDIRRRIYDRPVHPHIAACIIGLAFVDYYRALLVPMSRAGRTRLLRSATEQARAALRQREEQEGSVDLVESAKAARFLAKVALARHANPSDPKPQLTSVTEESTRELRFAAVEPLPPVGTTAGAAIEAWVRSPALAAVVEAFDEAATPESGSLAARLDWLAEFSRRWDYRGGRERNEVAAQEFDAGLRATVEEAAAALGLIGTMPPPSASYDHVLILGGLVRACLARPLHAARLLADGTISATAVTALGGHRPLKGDELDLAARLGYDHLTDEFDAMDSGVRAAFALSAPIAERGERSDVVGAGWRVHEYASDSGLPVRVIAAPSSVPGERRANTPDTYRWWASEVVRLAPGERVLLITSDIYVRYQHADALRMLALPFAVEIDAVGIQPGDEDPRLVQVFETHNYLQEIRSTILAFRNLHRELAETG